MLNNAEFPDRIHRKSEQRKCKLKTSCRSVAPCMIKFGWTTIFHVDFEAAFSNAEMYNPLTLHIVPAYCGFIFGYLININHFNMITLFNLQDKLSCLLLVNSL